MKETTISNKSDESNKKRLESLKQKAEEFKLKKSLIRSSLNDVNGSNQEIKPKKIVFNDSDSDSNDKFEKKPQVNVKKVKLDDAPKKQANQKVTENKQVKKKFSLIGSDGEESSDDDKAKGHKKSEDQLDAIQMFESKINLDEKRANQLIYLKTKYSNDDKRFKIDDRFIEDEEEKKKSTSSSSESESEAEDSDKEKAHDEDDEESKGVKTKKREIKSENLNSLRILEKITGKQIIKPTTTSSDKTSKNDKKMNKMVRYDPTKDEHKVFEMNKSDEESGSDGEKEKSKKNKNDQDDSAKANKIEEDLTKFYEIEPNIKELFSSNDVFKFKFTNEENDFDNEEDLNDETVEEVKTKPKLNGFSQFENLKSSKYSSESSSDEDEEEEEDDDEDDEEEMQDKNGRIDSKREPTSKMVSKKPADNNRQVEFNKTFLPNFEENKDIKNAAAFFFKKPEKEQTRTEWLSKREVLVNEYKKKHKRMLRIKKNKENEKLLPWRLTQNSNSKKK